MDHLSAKRLRRFSVQAKAEGNCRADVILKWLLSREAKRSVELVEEMRYWRHGRILTEEETLELDEAETPKDQNNEAETPGRIIDCVDTQV